MCFIIQIMDEANNGSEFLKKKYDLHSTPEVELAAQRMQARTGERVPQNPLLRIENYLDRFREIVDRKDPAKRERGIEALKKVLHNKFVIEPEEIPEAYWENQKRLMRERGQGADLNMVDWHELQEQNSEAIVADQRSSLDNWVDYLASSDATYPDWLKYWTLRNVVGLAKYDKEKKSFPKRTQRTINPFPELNREALAYVLDAVEKKHRGEKVTFTELEAKDKDKFDQLLHRENFAKLYAWAIEKVIPASTETLVNTKGRWVMYPQNSEHLPLVQSLQGHGTGWCTAGESTARIQLQGGDFHVFYSSDQNGKLTVPRVAIRMKGSSIAEIRGIAEEQNLDPFIGDVVEKKLQEFPDGEAYKKKTSDMQRLTAIAGKIHAGEKLNKDELIFIYEINGSIDGFGYRKDPRILELRTQRDPETDMPVVFGCRPEQIARGVDEINQHTRAYVGELVPGIFEKLPNNIEYIYISFPERKIRREKAEIGGKTPRQLQNEMERVGIETSAYVKDMLKNSDFTTLKNPEEINLIQLTVADLGFSDRPTTDEIYARAEELGLELCPAELGPQYLLQNPDLPLGDWRRVGMKQITDTDGDPCVFKLGPPGAGPWLNATWAEPDDTWPFYEHFLFRLRK